jgi:hyperosmotically inducible protein
MTAANAVRASGDTDRNPQAERVGMAGNAPARPITELAREVRRELLTELPYYGVFDWIEYEVRPDRTVVLRGHVTSLPDKKSRAESLVREIEGVSRVVNEIEVLPLSPNDERLRRQLYRAIYDFDSPLFRYGVGSRQSIHIVVRNGRVTLEGVVDSGADKQLAYTRARGVPGTFAVENNLRVDADRKY